MFFYWHVASHFTEQMQTFKDLVAFFSITAMFAQECPMVRDVHAAQRKAVRASHSIAQVQCALPE